MSESDHGRHEKPDAVASLFLLALPGYRAHSWSVDLTLEFLPLSPVTIGTF
jgi:hypothetical protein